MDTRLHDVHIHFSARKSKREYELNKEQYHDLRKRSRNAAYQYLSANVKKVFLVDPHLIGSNIQVNAFDADGLLNWNEFHEEAIISQGW